MWPYFSMNIHLVIAVSASKPKVSDQIFGARVQISSLTSILIPCDGLLYQISNHFQLYHVLGLLCSACSFWTMSHYGRHVKQARNLPRTWQSLWSGRIFWFNAFEVKRYKAVFASLLFRAVDHAFGAMLSATAMRTDAAIAWPRSMGC